VPAALNVVTKIALGMPARFVAPTLPAAGVPAFAPPMPPT